MDASYNIPGLTMADIFCYFCMPAPEIRFLPSGFIVKTDDDHENISIVAADSFLRMHGQEHTAGSD